MAVPAVIQVIAALLIVALLLFLGYWQYDKEKLEAVRSAGSLRKEVVIFQGVKDFKSSVNEVYDTTDASTGSFRDLEPSSNQLSGIEYSYNFWMYIDRTKSTNVLGDPSDPVGSSLAFDNGFLTARGGNYTVYSSQQKHLYPIILFLRGDPSVYKYKNACDGVEKWDLLVKNPVVKLEHGGDAITVEFNTVDTPDAHKPCDTADGTWEAANAHKVGLKGFSNSNLDNKWFMVTIVIQETVPTLSLSSRYQTQCSIYVNGKLKTSQRVQGRDSRTGISAPINAPVRQPTGHFYVNRIIKNGTDTLSIDVSSVQASDAGFLKMADLTYYNYSLDEESIKNLYDKKFNSKPALSASAAIGSEYAGDETDNISPPFDDALYEIET